MSGTYTYDPTGFIERLRTWKAGVCVELGMDPNEVASLDDTRDQYGGITVAWEATGRQEPSVGITGNRGWQCDGENPPTFTAETILRPDEWAPIIGVVGPKPQMFTREQELMLKGLAAEAAEQQV